ncbi:YjaG family protein [Psychrosphaera aquimarina]|uniref:YjaG family protein n=1 Tax=Psychrosphaera aquimarina TaxID=2044854 RepID=A0ABU3R256_9GAMM|nr:YjaG family protein [Psychrosphaera aquimarina]MDU0113748.1 YjaG family protein [Psychrosphaera aquimarina]
MANSSNEKSVHLKTNNFQRVRELSRKQQGVLSLALLERMKPNYQLFAQVTEFPQDYNLDNIVNSLWEKLLVKGAKVNFSILEEKIESLTPDELDFDMYGVYPAIYFCTGLLTYINGELSEDEYDSVAIAKISQGCIVHLIEYQAGETELDNESIREHELMAAEMSVLTELLDWLSITRLKDLDLKAIRTKALDIVFADGVTNIGIELEG